MTTDFGVLLVEQTPDAAIITTAGGVVLHWNKDAELPAPMPCRAEVAPLIGLCRSGGQR